VDDLVPHPDDVRPGDVGVLIAEFPTRGDPPHR
jgi:hypothetical protein